MGHKGLKHPMRSYYQPQRIYEKNKNGSLQRDERKLNIFQLSL